MIERKSKIWFQFLSGNLQGIFSSLCTVFYTCIYKCFLQSVYFQAFVVNVTRWMTFEWCVFTFTLTKKTYWWKHGSWGKTLFNLYSDSFRKQNIHCKEGNALAGKYGGVSPDEVSPDVPGNWSSDVCLFIVWATKHFSGYYSTFLFSSLYNYFSVVFGLGFFIPYILCVYTI